TEIRLVDPPVVKTPARPVKKLVVKKPVVVKKKPVVAKQKPVVKAKRRPPAFAVADAPKEPLDEIPLTERAQRLRTWLGRHPRPTSANVPYWPHQNSRVVPGARFRWLHGARALRRLRPANERAPARCAAGPNP